MFLSLFGSLRFCNVCRANKASALATFYRLDEIPCSNYLTIDSQFIFTNSSARLQDLLYNYKQKWMNLICRVWSFNFIFFVNKKARPSQNEVESKNCEETFKIVDIKIYSFCVGFLIYSYLFH